MKLSRNRLYIMLSVLSIAGYFWLFYNFSTIHQESESIEVCLIKHAVNIPCPSCGSTRSVITLMQGDFINSILINPFGILIALIMVFIPMLIIYDLTTKNDLLLRMYNKIEFILKKPKVAIPTVTLVIINWIWNISKSL